MKRHLLNYGEALNYLLFLLFWFEIVQLVTFLSLNLSQ